MAFPRMYHIRQHFEAPVEGDIATRTREELDRLDWTGRIKPGQTVAITAGSRGISNIDTIIRAACDYVRDKQAVPIIIPAMGSHGGGTAEGQRGILEGYGITAEAMQAEIRASMDTVIVDTTPQGIPVHFDKHAYEADHVLIVGRVKPHTGFVGEIESGLHKMMLIGLGKHAGAKIYHRAIQDFSFPEIIRAVANVVLEKCDVIGGLAIVENARDQTGLLAGVRPDEFFERERELLELSKRWLPRLPFPQTDLLIIDEIGKNISGTGLDTNVVGRKYNDHAATDRDDVNVRRIFVRGLTEQTHGNATGIGLSEFTNQRTVDAVDRHITAINSVTGGHPTAAMLPIAFATDAESVEAALQTVGLTPPDQCRVVQISNTLHLTDVLVSEAYADQIGNNAALEVVAGPFDFPLQSDGNLRSVVESIGRGH